MAIDIINGTVKVINDGNFLIATMPDGTIIPMQVDLIAQNGFVNRGVIELTVTLKSFVKTEDFEILKPHIAK